MRAYVFIRQETHKHPSQLKKKKKKIVCKNNPLTHVGWVDWVLQVIGRVELGISQPNKFGLG